MLDRFRSIAPGTVIPKPSADLPFVVEGRGIRRGSSALIYKVPSRRGGPGWSKGITDDEFSAAYQEFQASGKFTRAWAKTHLAPCLREGSCNFTSLGGILELLGLAHYSSRGIYQASTNRRLLPFDEASCRFIDRISAIARRSRRVRIHDGPPGLGNEHWFRGALATTRPRGRPGLAGRIALSDVAITQLAARCAAFPLQHSNQAAFDAWFYAEVDAVGRTVQATSPGTFWTFGRGQKLINILLKYACAAFHCQRAGLARLASEHAEFARTVQWLHAPVDRETLKHLVRLPGAPKSIGGPYTLISWWDREHTPAIYREIQEFIGTIAARKNTCRIHYEMSEIW